MPMLTLACDWLLVITQMSYDRYPLLSFFALSVEDERRSLSEWAEIWIVRQSEWIALTWVMLSLWMEHKYSMDEPAAVDLPVSSLKQI